MGEVNAVSASGANRDDVEFDNRLNQARRFIIAGQFDHAASSLVQLATERPGDINVRVALASLADKRGRTDLAIARWGKLADMSPKNTSIQASYIISLLKGRDFDTAQQCFDAHARYARGLGFQVLQVEIFNAREQYSDALNYIEALMVEHDQDFDLRVRYDLALQRNCRYDEAQALFRMFLEAAPERVDLLKRLALNAAQEANFALAAGRWRGVAEICPADQKVQQAYYLSLLQTLDFAQADKHIVKVKHLFSDTEHASLVANRFDAEERYQDAFEVLDGLLKAGAAFPGLALSCVMMLRKAERFDAAEARLAPLLKAAPNRPAFLMESVRIAKASWDNPLALQRCETLIETAPDDITAELEYLNLLAAKGDLDAAFERLDGLCGRVPRSTILALEFDFRARVRDTPQAVKLAETFLEELEVGSCSLMLREVWLHRAFHSSMALYYGNGDPDDLSRARAHLESLKATRPMNLGIRLAICKLYLAEEAFEALAREVDLLPDVKTNTVLEYRIWKAYWEGDLVTAKQLASEHAVLHRWQVTTPSRAGVLERLDERDLSPSKGEIILFTCIRDELDRLPWFLTYYRKIGVNRFIFIDNASTDGSLEYLLEQADVHVFGTDANYGVARSGMKWINELVQRYGSEGWVLYADVDEAMVFPGIEDGSLRRLTDYMELKDQEAVYGFMLDMFANDDDELPPSSEPVDFLQTYRRFENFYNRNPQPLCPFEHITGGARRQLHLNEHMTKTPLIRGGRGIQFLGSSHAITPARLSDVTCAMLHYKLVGDLQTAFEDDVTNTQRIDWCYARHASYIRHFKETGGRVVISPEHADTYRSSQQLVDLGLIAAPDDFISGDIDT